MEEGMVAFVEQAIEAFLAQRPASADSLEGIHRWWIQWPVVEEPLQVTETALQRLVVRGVVEQVMIGSRVLWRGRRLS